MLLCIIFNNESIPFILSEATEEECLRAIEKAKKDFNFNEYNYIVESDRIILHAIKKETARKKRLYCFEDDAPLC